MKIIPTSDAKASSVNLVKYLHSLRIRKFWTAK